MVQSYKVITLCGSSIALEVAKYGITVNCVAPGPTQTGWIDADLEQSVLPVIPMGAIVKLS